MVVLPSVVVASETERLSSFSPHPCKDVETKDPTKMATWHAACASLSLETAVNTALMTLCLEMLGKSHAYLTTLESGQLTLSPRFQLPWRRNLNKAQYNNKTPCKMAITDHTESQIAMKIQKKTANYFNAKPCKVYIYMMAASGLPVPPPPPRMGWVQNLRFSYIFMEPAKTHGIYTVLTSSASETVGFAAFCNTTLYTTTLIVLLLQKQQQLVLLLPLLRTTTYYYVLLRTTTYYYVLLRTTTYAYVPLRTTTYYVYVLRTTYYVLRICTTYMYYGCRTTYTYTWLQMVRPPQPTHRGGGRGNIMCICSIFVCIHNKNDIPTLRAHVHTYIQTNHKSIQTKSSHT